LLQVWLVRPTASTTGTGDLLFSGLGSASSANTTYASFLSTVNFNSYPLGATFVTNGSNIEMVPVPEPTTILGIAALGLGMIRLRRRVVG